MLIRSVSPFSFSLFSRIKSIDFHLNPISRERERREEVDAISPLRSTQITHLLLLLHLAMRLSVRKLVPFV